MRMSVRGINAAPRILNPPYMWYDTRACRAPPPCDLALTTTEVILVEEQVLVGIRHEFVGEVWGLEDAVGRLGGRTRGRS
jgi:hypothetical protein